MIKDLACHERLVYGCYNAHAVRLLLLERRLLVGRTGDQDETRAESFLDNEEVEARSHRKSGRFIRDKRFGLL